ncbi:YggS family pyridoxal phosphate-dependent enzyme [Salinicoccus sp. HZC-1]|uniref:YggS family pyridoxal phosphate-dependent enzyme n=1 Tax=Salinicoccus sp. HZC-1 TaxID=3385497 RepID=UPI00398B1A14
MIKDNYTRIKEKIGDAATLIAVTKYHTAEQAVEAYEAGVRHFGENRPEGFLEKKKALPEDAIVHFIGTLQSRKVKQIIDDMHYLHSLDRESVAKKIEQYSEHTVKCFIQVNVSGEDSKHGLTPEEVPEFLERLSKYKKVEVIGLMTMAPNTDDRSLISDVFRKLSELKDELAENNHDNIQIKELSMGMSNDYDVALEYGATFVRVGSKIMGSR